jgi:hypothetical protein
MKLDVAKKLNHFVNQDYFNEALDSYIQERVDMLHSLLEISDPENTKTHQGGISELRKLSTLRKDVNAVLDLARK